MSGRIFECVVNVSEGRDEVALAEFAEAAGTALLDVHRDPHHHRSVFTLAGQPELVAARARALATTVVARLDLRDHVGVHPRLGVLDVVPFVPYEPGGPPPADLSEAMELREDFARWLGAELGVPAFVYGPAGEGSRPPRARPAGADAATPAPTAASVTGGRTLPEVRRGAFRTLSPEYGPPEADPRSGATAVGARPVLVAYNVWVSSPELARHGRGKGPVPRCSHARSHPGRSGPGVVQPRRPRPDRPGRRVRRGAPPRPPHSEARWKAPSWSVSSPRSC